MPPTLKPPHRAIQLKLFRLARDEPSWEVIPPEVQQQVLRLLARILRDHAVRWQGEPMPPGDRDE